MILKDIALSGADPEPYASTMDFMHGKEGNTVMVNGQVNPVLSIRPGQVQRWRVLNASNARFYMLSLEGHTLSVVGTEGGLLDRPYPQSQILQCIDGDKCCPAGCAAQGDKDCLYWQSGVQQNVAPAALDGARGVAPRIYETADTFPLAFESRWAGAGYWTLLVTRKAP